MEGEALGPKRKAHPAALCPRPGRKGPRDAVGSGPRPLLPGRGQQRCLQPASPARAAFPGRFVRRTGEKKHGKGLNCTLLPTPRQIRGRGQDPNDLVVSAGGTGEIIISTQSTLPRLPQSRAAPSRCSGRGFPAEHSEQRAQPALPGARCCSVRVGLRFDLFVQNPRAMG